MFGQRRLPVEHVDALGLDAVFLLGELQGIDQRLVVERVEVGPLAARRPDDLWHRQVVERVERVQARLQQPLGLVEAVAYLPNLLRCEVGVYLCAHGYPSEPSISSSMRRLSSTAYSMGNSSVMGSMNPATIICLASSSSRPRLWR